MDTSSGDKELFYVELDNHTLWEKGTVGADIEYKIAICLTDKDARITLIDFEIEIET